MKTQSEILQSMLDSSADCLDFIANGVASGEISDLRWIELELKLKAAMSLGLKLQEVERVKQGGGQ